MSDTSIVPTNKAFPKPQASLWETKTADCRRDLVIKKIAITIIALLNFAALGAALYLIICCFPISTQALFVSPFIVGVLAALAYLKFPTCGVSSLNYTNYVNPTALLGRVMAYVFFGPLMYASNQMDWTPYHDPVRANKISKDLEELSFEKIADEHGKHFRNLTKYGFIDKSHDKDLQALYKAYVPIKKELDFWKKEGLEDCAESKAANTRKAELEEKWKALKTKCSPFPHPKKPQLDFSKKMTNAKLGARSFCCFGPPIYIFRDFKA